MKSLLPLCLLPGLSHGVVTTLTPTDIHGGDTNTTSFSDGNVTLTPFIGSTAATFNSLAARLGIDDQTGTGTNNAAFNDPDLDPNNGNEEKLQFAFAPTVGLSQISYDFSRADGPGTGFSNDGVIISGFTADPTLTFSATITNLFYAWDATSGSVRINIPGGAFNNDDISINFDPDASRGQTLLLSVTDESQGPTQAQTGGQFAVLNISYDVVPEPSALALRAFGGRALLRRRRG